MNLARSQRHKFTSLIILFLILSLDGCEAFVRKFTRKKERANEEEVVIAPQEYKIPPKDQLYRQGFLFWQSWQDELIESLNQNRSHKKIIDCVQEAIKNLNSLRSILNEEQKKKIDVYISRMNTLQEGINEDLYGNQNKSFRQNAESLKMNIQKNFSYSKIKNSLI